MSCEEKSAKISLRLSADSVLQFYNIYVFGSDFEPNLEMQGCRAILLDKDKNPKVILTFCLLVPVSWTLLKFGIFYF